MCKGKGQKGELEKQQHDRAQDFRIFQMEYTKTTTRDRKSTDDTSLIEKMLAKEETQQSNIQKKNIDGLVTGR